MHKFLSIFKEYPDDFIFTDYEWEYKELIGQGSFGKIFKVRNQKTNKFDAIKQLDMKNFDEQFKVEALKNEIEIMNKIKSQNIVELKDSFMGKKFTYIVLQLCDSDLRKILVTNQGKLPEKLCCEIFSQLSQGFHQINKNQYMHRDIKPENILVKENVFKVADFGFTKKVKKNEKVGQVCGTPLYMAPQLIFNEKYTDKCDIWSLGLMLYEMIFGYNPWPTKHPQVYKNSIKTKPICFPFDAKIGKNTLDFLKQCLKVEENERLSWQQFFNHPFVKQKNIGEPIKFPNIEKKTQIVLKSIQESVLRKNIDFLTAFQRHSKKLLTKTMRRNDIFTFLREIDPTITTYQADQLFLLCDNDKDGKISLDEFHDIFCAIDFRSVQDAVSRRIQEIIAVAQARNLSMKKLFQLFDKDKSNTIQRQEFEDLIRKIVPMINSFEIQQIWNRFDSDKSGKIQTHEFFSQMTRNCDSDLEDGIERARRNIFCLGNYLESRKASLKEFFRRTDTNNDNRLTLEQFGIMIQKINYEISKEEIIEMFKLFDINKNQFLDLREMEAKITESKIK